MTTTLPSVYEQLLNADLKTQMPYSVRTSLVLNGYMALSEAFPEQEPKELSTVQAAIMLICDPNARGMLIGRDLLMHFDEAVNRAVENWRVNHATTRIARVLTDHLPY
jgi:hypothetical protein